MCCPFDKIKDDDDDTDDDDDDDDDDKKKKENEKEDEEKEEEGEEDEHVKSGQNMYIYVTAGARASCLNAFAHLVYLWSGRCNRRCCYYLLRFVETNLINFAA